MPLAHSHHACHLTSSRYVHFARTATYWWLLHADGRTMAVVAENDIIVNSNAKRDFEIIKRGKHRAILLLKTNCWNHCLKIVTFYKNKYLLSKVPCCSIGDVRSVMDQCQNQYHKTLISNVNSSTFLLFYIKKHHIFVVMWNLCGQTC